MLKKILTFSLFSLLILDAYSQREKIENLPNFDKRPIHYGFYLGLNTNGYKVAYKTSAFNADIEVTEDVGFNVGLIADMRLHKNVNLRFEPGLISNTKTLRFKHIVNEIEGTREVGNTYLHLPFIFKFSTDRLNNIRPYVLGGASFDYNFSSNEKNQDDNFSGQFRQTSSNFMYEVGIGIDLYLPYFKFSPSIRGIFAINNELIYDNRNPSQWTDPIDFLGSRGIFLHLSFE
ncbi:type IX secretion/gliding motility protein PorT/SprT [Tenacibaculum sp. M341]|uniref:type IX secretion/gliding motility protein PorT/SprT n=1 Tax=Tenacibaculum sp. M341 TaxID=2530339 RepID=UPI00104BF4D5|nr:porin family protein [Tenacibaculum sp. M341]TCI91525.1 PorT family protein [Tenacibaculum sp. M341]